MHSGDLPARDRRGLTRGPAEAGHDIRPGTRHRTLLHPDTTEAHTLRSMCRTLQCWMWSYLTRSSLISMTRLSTAAPWLTAGRSPASVVVPRSISQTVLAEILRLRDWFWSDPERHRVGRLDLRAARRQIAEMAVTNVGCDDRTLAARIAERYDSCRDTRTALFPGAVDVLTWLRGSGCRLALLTNGAADAQREKIERFRLEPLFDLILIEGELGFGKPDERIYRLALTELAAYRGTPGWLETIWSSTCSNRRSSASPESG